jgi:hypothetical protein
MFKCNSRFHVTRKEIDILCKQSLTELLAYELILLYLAK